MALTPFLPTALPQPLRPPASEGQLEALAADLLAAGLAPLCQSAQLEALSADAFVYSPVLAPLLQGLRAQMGVRVSSSDQVLRVAAACARQRAMIPRRACTLRQSLLPDVFDSPDAAASPRARATVAA
jgi:hypothetical protein